MDINKSLLWKQTCAVVAKILELPSENKSKIYLIKF